MSQSKKHDGEIKRLNKLGEEWFALDPEKDSSIKDSYFMEIYSTAYSILEPYFYNWKTVEIEIDSAKNGSNKESIYESRDEWARLNDGLFELMCGENKEFVRKFDPTKGPLYAFLYERSKKRLHDMLKKADGVYKEKGDEQYTQVMSLDAPKEEGSESWINNEIDRGVSCFDDTTSNDSYLVEHTIRFIAMILDFTANVRGKSKNKPIYYPIFFVGDILYHLHEAGLSEPYARNERMVFGAINCGFLDYVMKGSHRTISTLVNGMRKSYQELVPNGAYAKNEYEGIEEVRLPLDNAVYVSYRVRVDRPALAESTINQHVSIYLSEYEKFKREVIL